MPNSREEGSTAFVVAGKGTGFGPENPYLIFHYYKPGLQTNYGFFFSPTTFEFFCHLPDKLAPKRFLDDGLKSSGLLEKSKALLSRVLKTKGFRNYQSLQYWIHSKRTPSVMDTKCKFDDGSKCWYCNDLCEICLEPSAFGPSCTDSANNNLQFCSEECYDLYNCVPRPRIKVFLPDDQNNPDRKVPVGHKEYLHLFSCGKLDNGSAGFITSISLCEGNGSNSFPIDQYYVNFHLRMPQYQSYYEVFVSDDLQPLGSVCYPCALYNLFRQSDENALKIKALSIVSDTIKSSGAVSVTDFLQKIKLYDIVGGTLVLSSGREHDQKSEEITMTSNPHGNDRGPAEEKVESRDGQLVIDPHQFQDMLQQCGGDQKKLVEMIQKLTASPRNEAGPQVSSESASTELGNVVVAQDEPIATEESIALRIEGSNSTHSGNSKE